MDKTQTSSQKERWFFSDEFQARWKNYKNAFGEDIDTIFGNDYDKKLRLSEGLEYLFNDRLHDAYHAMRHLEPACLTDADRRVFDRLMALCRNEKEMATVKAGDWVKRSGSGYYKVINRTPECAVIKRGFDNKLAFARESEKVDGFAIELTDLMTYQLLEEGELLKIESFFEEFPDKEAEFLRYTDTMLSLREELLKSNFKEAEWSFRQFSFYRFTLDKVAFAVNLKDYGEHIGVTYGFTTVAEGEHFRLYGEDDFNIKLRFYSVIKNESDKNAVADQIKNVYDTYSYKSRDDILALKKERQKQFLQKIAERLKQLGFKKKGAKWTLGLEGDFCLEFEAQKSQYSDEYYFNVRVYHKDVQFPCCYYTRLNTNQKGVYDWQLMTEGELNALLDEAALGILAPIIKTPLATLGGKSEIWQCCSCPRNKCNVCWVQKNLWEANEN